MKLLPLFLLFGVTAGVFSVAPAQSTRQSVPARRAVKRTVRDYYLLLPPEYTTDSARDNLRFRLVVNDIVNDYLETSGEAGQPSLQTALFRHRGAELFVVSALYEIGSTLKFYRWRGGRLREVTREVWPVKLGPEDVAVLPRHGTAIVIKDERESGQKRAPFKMLWRAGRFSKAKR